MAKYTRKDIEYLAGCLSDTADTKSKPYAVLIGAGVSKSAGIPTAPELVREINDTPGLARHLRELSEVDRQDYARCMSSLTQEDRRLLLDDKLQAARVNWASLVIGTFLKRGYLRRVLSFNFDNVLARACGICGHYPPIYDFSVTPPQEFSSLKEGGIIHLHGQGAGLVMLNSKTETEKHAEQLRPLFIDTLATHNLIVIGYSGLADASFAKLAEVFTGRNRLFWIGYSEDMPSHVKTLADKAPDVFDFFGDADADRFLLELGQTVDCWPPDIFTAPEQHLLDEIKPVISFPADFPGDDVLTALKNELEELAKQRAKNDDTFQQLLLGGKYAKLVAMAGDAKTKPQKSAVAWAYVAQGNTLSDLAKQKRNETLYRESFGKYEAALGFKPDMHEALSNWGAGLADLAKLKQDETLYRESFGKYEAALRIKPDKHEALHNWGVALANLAKLKQDETLYRDSFGKYEAALRINPDMHDVLNNWGAGLLTLWHLNHDRMLLPRALDLAMRAEAIDGKPSYNVACALALMGRETECEEQLRKCKAAGTLLDAAHLQADIDLAAYRDRDWFKDLLTEAGLRSGG